MSDTDSGTRNHAIKMAVVYLLDPDASGNRTERAMLEELYPVLRDVDRRDILDYMARQGYDRAAVAEKMNDFEQDHFGVRGSHI